MQLSQLFVQNAQGAVLPLPLEDNSAGFSVQEIDGLDPVKATLVSSSFANMDGAQYHSSRREPRNLIVKLGFDPDYSKQDVESLRRQLYSFLMPKSNASFTFRMFDKFAADFASAQLDLEISGYVESFDAPLFTRDPGADLSVMCFDPDFVDPRVIEVDGETVSNLTETLVTYAGTVDTGVIFTIMPDRDLDAFTIYHRPPDQTLWTIDFQYPMVAGDILTISSVPGNKYVVLTSGGVQTPVLYALSPQSAWHALSPGDNHIRVYAAGAPVPYKFTYTNRYGGL